MNAIKLAADAAYLWVKGEWPAYILLCLGVGFVAYLWPRL